MGIQIPIFEYHDLSRTKVGGRSFHSPYVLEETKFRQHMEWLYNNQYQTLCLDDLFNKNLPEKAVVLTFDDGHISNYKIAFPILKTFNFQANFFLVSQFIDKEDYLSTVQIHKMQEKGMHFGSHSATHPYMLSITKQQMSEELIKSKTDIQHIIERPVKHFCIPYGFYDKELIQGAIHAGYKSVVTEKMGYYKANHKDFKILPRFTVKSTISMQLFEHIVTKRKIKLLPNFVVENILELLKSSLGFNIYIRLKALLLGEKPA